MSMFQLQYITKSYNEKKELSQGAVEWDRRLRTIKPLNCNREEQIINVVVAFKTTAVDMINITMEILA